MGICSRLPNFTAAEGILTQESPDAAYCCAPDRSFSFSNFQSVVSARVKSVHLYCSANSNLSVLLGRLGDEELIFRSACNVTIRPSRQPVDFWTRDSLPTFDHILRLSSVLSDRTIGLLCFRCQEFANLVVKADGLYEWARLACEYIREDLPSLSPMDCLGSGKTCCMI
ncbi:hypothetical protein EV424DRAFT_1106871 [Suillus variegatus]|nr:hypothetical protein EV424DRAFT_1456708 [Suillus variegatus]KAG1815339.1 hypothetical protein EV424DRAFT_1106871 [Suillus variegatus]